MYGIFLILLWEKGKIKSLKIKSDILRRNEMVKKKINFDVRRYKSIFIYVIFIIFMVIVIINKKNLHTDEIYSYTLANNVGSISINFDEGHTYSPVEGIYLNNISVSDSSKQFNLKNEIGRAHV